MSVKLISNDHMSTLVGVFRSVKSEIEIISPFISMSMTKKLCEVLKTNPLIKCNVITRFYRDDFIHCASDVEAIKLLVESGAHVYALKNLHTKLYLLDSSVGMLGSANFTSGGFFLNHELSLFIENEDDVLDEMHQYFDNIMDQIGNFEISVDKVTQESAIVKEKKTQYSRDLKKGIHTKFEAKFGAEIELPKISEEDTRDSIQNILEPIGKTSDIKFFLKPVGVTESPFVVGRVMIDDDIYFSKTYPSAVDKGSILICYGVGVQMLIGYYEVLSEKAKVNPHPFNPRWPHFVESKCLSHKFSNEWWVYKLILGELRDEFVLFYPDVPVTYKGSQSLGALNWGSDKIRLSPEFAQFLIEKIDNCIR